MCLKTKIRFCSMTLASLASLCLLVQVSLAVAADPPKYDCPDCTQRLTFVNNCDDDAEIQALIPSDATAKPQWDFWKPYGAMRYSGFDEKGNPSGDQYVITKLPHGESATFGIPDAGVTSGRFSFALGCDASTQTEKDPWGKCKMGPTSGKGWYSINSIFEITAGCRYEKDPLKKNSCVKNGSDPKKGPLSEQDNFDLGAVDGYTVPLSVEVTNNDKNAFACTRNKVDGSLLDLASCPAEYSQSDEAKKIAQTLKLTPEDADDPKLKTFFAKKDPISMLTKDTDGSVKACSSPCKWITANGDVGSPGVPVRLIPGEAFKDTTNKKEKLIPNTADYYCCACRGLNDKNQVIEPIDPKCVYPGCSGVSCMDRWDINPQITGDDRRYSMPMSNYVKRLKAMGFEGYTWQFDDKLGLVQCDKWGAKITVTICPAGSGGKPYDLANRKWAYSAKDNKCVLDSNGKYASLFDCQSTDKDSMNKYMLITNAEINGQGRGNKTQKYCVWDGAAGKLTLEDCEKQAAGDKAKAL